MGKKSIKKNYIYNLTYQILILIVPLITTPYLSRVLGAENIGIYSYTLSIATYFILFGSLGVAMYGQREIAYVQNNRYERSKNFFEILIMRFITLGISLIIFYLVFAWKRRV
jgi:O-antigen/teichoic acid export membrane protein